MIKLNKNNIKLVIFSFILGIIFTTVGVFAATIITADQVSYKDKALDEAIDVLYDRSSNLTKFCKLIEGTFGEVSSKYECDPGDGTKRNFYLLANNTDNSVELIMEHNITEGSGTPTMTWNDAMKYFRIGAGASTKAAWVNVIDVNLPSAQDIANAVGNTGWNMEDKNKDGWFYFDKSNGSYGQTQVANASNLSKYRWLYNYTRECLALGCDPATSLDATEAYGYWTRDIVAQQKDSTGYAWRVDENGRLGGTPVYDSANLGVRPVITVLKSNLYQ